MAAFVLDQAPSIRSLPAMGTKTTIGAGLLAGLLLVFQCQAEEKDSRWLYAQIGAYEHYDDDEDFRT